VFGFLAYVFSLLLMFSIVCLGYTKLTVPSEAAPTIAARGPTTASIHTVSAKRALSVKKHNARQKRH
jgi:hypothetical protein